MVLVSVLFFLSMLIIPASFDELIKKEIHRHLKTQLKTDLTFKEAEISFFDHFPSLTFSFSDIRLQGLAPFTNEPLAVADELAFGIDVVRLIFKNEVVIEKIILTRSTIRMKKDRFGRSNYSIVAEDTLSNNDSFSTLAGFNLQNLRIKDSRIEYRDELSGITLLSESFNYKGKGGLKDQRLELKSQLDVEQIGLRLNGIDYLKGKTLSARALTFYDAKAIFVHLDENDISLNDLDLRFEGNINLFEQGVAYDYSFVSRNNTLPDLMSVLEPKYMDWSEKVSLQGNLEARLELTGYSGMVPDSLQKSHTNLELRLANGSLMHREAEQAIDNLFLNFKSSVKDERINMALDTLSFTLGQENTNGAIFVSGRKDSLIVRSDFHSTINLDKLEKSLQFPGLTVGGLLDAKWRSEGLYQPSASKFPRTQGYISIKNGLLKTDGFPEPISDIALDAQLQNTGTTYQESQLIIDDLEFTFLEQPFYAQAVFKNFDAPEYTVVGKGTLNLEKLNEVLPFTSVLRGGSIKADVSLKGKMSRPNAQEVELGKPLLNMGTLQVADVAIGTNTLENPLLVRSGTFQFLQDKMAFSNLALEHVNSTATVKGYFKRYMDYLLFSEGVLSGSMDLQSDFIDVAAFFPVRERLSNPEGQAEDSISIPAQVEEVVDGVLPVPENIDISLRSKVDSIQYNNLKIRDFSGILAIKEGGMFVQEAKMGLAKGSARLDGFYRPLDPDEALFSLDMHGRNVDIEEAYRTMKIVQELVPVAEQASGSISFDYSLSGALDSQMVPVRASLKGKGDLYGQDVRIDRYKLLASVSEKSGFNTLENPNLSTINITSQIENNILDIERFKFRIRPFRLRAEGETSLEGALNLQMRIGLPPFGIIGIPVTITGTSDDYKVKLGKKALGLAEIDYEEDSYSEEERRRMLLLSSYIKDGMSLDEIEQLQKKVIELEKDSLPFITKDSLEIEK